MLAVANHPNRSKRTDNPARHPTPAEISAARERAGLSIREASRLCFMTVTAWSDCEDPQSGRRMGAASWWLFRLQVGFVSLADLRAATAGTASGPGSLPASEDRG